jgi:hypothetical protein
MEYAFRKTLALADAELSAAEVPALVQELARNPSLVRALQVYIAVGRRRIAKPYAAKRDEPVPQWLIDTVMRAPMERAADRSARVVSFGGKLLDRMRNNGYRTPGWAVAGPALAAVLALFVWQQTTGGSPGGVLMTAKLQSALEHTAGAEDHSLSGFRPLLTYWSHDQAWCRQFEMRSSAERTFAVACRADDGHWGVVMQTPSIPVGILPAGSPREHLDRYVASRMNGPPLETPQVMDVMKSNWPPPAAQ